MDIYGEPHPETQEYIDEDAIEDADMITSLNECDNLSEYRSNAKGSKDEVKNMTNDLEEIYQNSIEKYIHGLSPNEMKSLSMYKQLNKPRNYKHYVAQAYREMFQLNPFDNLHFISDELNPNFGFLDAGSNDFASMIQLSSSSNTNDIGLMNNISKLNVVNGLSLETQERA